MPQFDNTKGVFSEKALSVSVVICTYSLERCDDLERAIKSMRDQTTPLHEIIIVVDHNEELLNHLKVEYPDIILTANKMKKGLSGGRNTGVSVATGDLIIFLDDDAFAEPDWIEKHCSHYSDPNVYGVGSKIEPLWQTGRPSWFPEEYDWVVGCSYRGVPETLQSVNKVMGCSSFRKEVFDVVGGFSLSLGRIRDILLSGEESEFCFRIKKQWKDSIIYFDPEAIMHHQVPPTRTKWTYFQRRCFFGGVSNYLVIRLAGAKIGLSTESQYVLKTLSRGVFRYFLEGLRGKGTSGFKKAGVLIIGFSITAAGYLWAAIYSTFGRRKFEKLVYG